MFQIGPADIGAEIRRNGRRRYVSCRAQRGRRPPPHQAKELGRQGTRCHSRVLYCRCRRYPIDWSVRPEEGKAASIHSPEEQQVTCVSDGRPQSREAVKIPRRRRNEVGLVTKDETEAEPDIVNEWTLEHTDAGSCKRDRYMEIYRLLDKILSSASLIVPDDVYICLLYTTFAPVERELFSLRSRCGSDAWNEGSVVW